MSASAPPLATAMSIFTSAITLTSAASLPQITSSLDKLQHLYSSAYVAPKLQEDRKKRLSSDRALPVMDMHEVSLRNQLANAKRSLKPTSRDVKRKRDDGNTVGGVAKKDKKEKEGDVSGKKVKEGTVANVVLVVPEECDVGDEIKMLRNSVYVSGIITGVVTEAKTFCVELENGEEIKCVDAGEIYN